MLYSLSYAFLINSGEANATLFISTGTSTPGVYSKSDPSMSDVLNGSKKSADTNKKQTEVVPTQDSNGTDNQCQIVEHHSPSELLAGMCTPYLLLTYSRTHFSS